jgi:hypothetical protein
MAAGGVVGSDVTIPAIDRTELMVVNAPAEFFARPKSSSLAPFLVRKMFPGLRSRWTTPARCAVSSAAAILDCDREGLVEREYAFLQARGERLALEVLHHEELEAVLAAHVEQRADVWVAERRDHPCFAVETVSELGIGSEIRREDLDGDGPVETRVAGAIDLAHAARAQRDRDFIGAKPSARLEGHLTTVSYAPPTPMW